MVVFSFLSLLFETPHGWYSSTNRPKQTLQIFVSSPLEENMA